MNKKKGMSLQEACQKEEEIYARMKREEKEHREREAAEQRALWGEDELEEVRGVAIRLYRAITAFYKDDENAFDQMSDAMDDAALVLEGYLPDEEEADESGNDDSR